MATPDNSHYDEWMERAGDGLPLWWRRWRPIGEMRAQVCLVHGIGEYASRYAAMAEALARAGYALLAFDLRGHGKSGGIRGHAPDYAQLIDDIDLLVREGERQAAGRPCFLYGHSMGGNFALNYVLRRHPSLAGVAAVAPALRVKVPLPPLKLLAARLLYRFWPTFQFYNGIDLAACVRDPRVVGEHEADPLGHAWASARLGLDLLDSGAWALDHAAEFGVPLLLMSGGDDQVVSNAATYDFAARVRGDCTVREWPGMYHELHSEAEREAVFAYLIAWMDARG